MTNIEAVCLTLVEPLANADKFWNAYLAERPDGGYRLAINFGRNGTDGQVQVKDFHGGRAAFEAGNYLNRKVAEKLAKGYDRQHLLESTPPILAQAEKLLALPKPQEPRTPNLLEVCETQIEAAADAVGSRKALSPATVAQYRAARSACAELERRYMNLQSTMETISELYEQKVTA